MASNKESVKALNKMHKKNWRMIQWSANWMRLVYISI